MDGPARVVRGALRRILSLVFRIMGRHTGLLLQGAMRETIRIIVAQPEVLAGGGGGDPDSGVGAHPGFSG